MGTLSRLLVKNIDKETFAEIIRNNYNIGRTEELDYKNRHMFLETGNYNFIIFDAYINGWTEMELDYYRHSIEEHDDFLLKLSKDYNTKIIFGYNQTTIDDARLLVLDNGNIIRSIYQKSYFEPHRIIMEHNYGERLQTEQLFKYPELGKELEMLKHKFLSFDELQEMFTDAGY